MKKTKKIYLYLMIFIIIYIEFGYYMIISNFLPGMIRMGILITITLPLLFLYRKFQFNLILLLLYNSILITINIIRGDFSNNILLFIPIFIGFLIASKVEIKIFIKIYNDIMYFLSCFSLLIYGINLTFPLFIQKLPYIGNVYTSIAEIHNAFFAVAITKSINIRNYGIAWEPGAFSLLICLALFLELTNNRRFNFKYLIIYIITIITTFSTVGYLFIIGILGSIFSKEIKNKKNRKITIIGFVSILIFFIYMPNSIKELVFFKLKGLFFGDLDNLSYTTRVRVNAIYYPFLAFLSSPVLGVGYEKFSEINKLLCDGMATNTIINWFAVLGLSFGVPCLLGTYKFIKSFCKTKQITKVGFFIIFIEFLMIFSTESLLRISLIYIIIFYGFSKKLQSIN